MLKLRPTSAFAAGAIGLVAVVGAHAQPAPPTFFDGFAAVPEGCTLVPEPLFGLLALPNSGVDAFSVDAEILGADGAVVSASGGPSPITLGSSLNLTFNKIAADVKVATASMTETVGEVENTLTFLTPGVDEATLTLLSQGVVVFEETFPIDSISGAGLPPAAKPSGSVGLNGSCKKVGDKVEYKACASITINFLQGDLAGDSLIITADDPCPDASSAGVTISADQLQALAIEELQIVHEGLKVSGLGQAQVKGRKSADHLVISNIGASGDDGWEAEFDPDGPTEGFLVELNGLELDEPGSSANVIVVGDLNSFPDADLGGSWVQAPSAGGPLQVFADYTPIGVTTVEVAVFADGSKVGQVQVTAVNNLPIAGIIADGIGGCGKLPGDGGPLDPPCIVWLPPDPTMPPPPPPPGGAAGGSGGPTPTVFLLPDASGALTIPVSGDELRVLALGAPPLGPYKSFKFQVAFDDEFDVGEVTDFSPPPACPADLDGSGAIGSGDLNIVLGDFGCSSGDCPGNIDGDGDTDSADLNAVLAAFGDDCP